MTVDTKKYIEFVYGVTSAPSQDSDVLQEKISELVLGGADVSHLLTAALGLTAESGEFTEIVKKILLQGKPCLLYTSPSPRDLSTSRMPSSA